MEIRLKPFREIHATNLGSCSIKNEMESRGYVLIRELLPCQDLKPLLGEIMQLVYEAGCSCQIMIRSNAWYVPMLPAGKKILLINPFTGKCSAWNPSMLSRIMKPSSR